MTVRRRNGDGDMVGRDEEESAFGRGHARVPGEVAWLVEGVGHASVRAMHGEPIRVLCLLTCANRQWEESQIRHARGRSPCQPERRIGVPDDGNINWWSLA